MKKKLRLQIETLRVERFEVHPDSPVIRGTVQGHESDLNCDTSPYTGQIGPSEPWRYCVEMPGTMYRDISDCC